MFLKKNTINTRSLLTLFAVFALAVTVLWWSANNSTINASSKTADDINSPAATFPGTGVGAIPDSPSSGTYGTPLVINFAVSGVARNVSSVSADVTLTHSWVGDIDMRLAAPGGSPSFPLVSRIGAVGDATTDLGDNANYAGTYTFTDAATGTNIWSEAASSTSTNFNIPATSYRTTAPGGAGTTNPAAVTNLNAAFSNLTPAQANGNWTLTVRDRNALDTGSVTAANLNIASAARSGLFDFTGDARTDFTVLTLPTGGQITWKVAGNPAPAGANQAFIRIFNYGLTSDKLEPADYSGDSKSEVTVWRRASQAIFYQAQFPNGTGGVTLERAVRFGTGVSTQNTDQPDAIGDYDGDGKIDYAVARYNGNTNALTWYILTSVTNTFRAVSFGLAPETAQFTATNGADFNGDGRDELVFLSLDADNNETWYAGDAVNGTYVISRQFGNFDTDYAFTPADYTGDGKADFVIVRETTGNQAIWYVNNSVTNAITSTPFGIPGFSATSDIPVRGDYDGDGIQDIAVWRPTNQTFYYKNSSNGTLQGQQWGAAGDFPLGNFGTY